MIREEYNYWLSNIQNIGNKKIGALLSTFESAEAVYRASKAELKQRTQLNEKDLEAIILSRKEEIIRTNYDKLRQRGIYFVSREQENYPEKLKEIYDSPFSIYVKGKLPPRQQKIIAIVGARNCSSYGKEMAKYIASGIAKAGVAVISGLARGIDAHAHEGALAVEGDTYGVLGCGIDQCYPKENINIYMEMQKNGGIISEYAPGLKPQAYHFPMRNRIISGLSDGVVVIEAKEKSGSLITVDMGLDQGKDIYALPGRVTDQLSNGCNNLIKMGAKLVTSPEDILEELMPNDINTMGDSKKNVNMLESKGKIVYACLSLEPKHIEEIAIKSNLSMDQLMEQLLMLELQGYVCQTMKNYYKLV